MVTRTDSYYSNAWVNLRESVQEQQGAWHAHADYQENATSAKEAHGGAQRADAPW